MNEDESLEARFRELDALATKVNAERKKLVALSDFFSTASGVLAFLYMLTYISPEGRPIDLWASLIWGAGVFVRFIAERREGKPEP